MTHTKIAPIDVLLTWPADGVRLFESMIPLGLASLAAMLEQHGYRVQIIDFNHYRKDFRVHLSELRPKLVGIGGTTTTRQSSFLTARLVKEVFPDLPVVYGGPHASFAYEDTLLNIPQIDFILRGEAEYSLLALCEILVRNGSQSIAEIPGIALRKGDQIITRSPERIQNLSGLPVPARQMFGRIYPMTIDHTEIPADFLVTSRGCPVICDFCSASRMFPGGVRLRPMDEVRAEVQTIVHERPDVRGLKVFDSTFTANRQHVLEFCALMTEFQLSWECEVRADTVDFEMLSTMRKAGCVFVSIGFETTDEELLRRMGKRITKEQVDQVLSWCKQLGIICKVFFTFGHLGETMQTCLTDLKYLRANRERIQFYGTTIGIRIYPGTVLEYKARKAGLLPSNFSWAKFKAPLRNWWVLEPSDVLILEQPGLRLPQLGRLIVRLLWQGTALSPSYILKMIPLNLYLLCTRIAIQLRYTQHRWLRFWTWGKLA